MQTLEELKTSADGLARICYREESSLRHAAIYRALLDGSDEVTMVAIAPDIEPRDMPKICRETAFKVGAYAAVLMFEAWHSKTSRDVDIPMRPVDDPDRKSVVSIVISHPLGYTSGSIDLNEEGGGRVLEPTEWHDDVGDHVISGRQFHLVLRGNSITRLKQIMEAESPRAALIELMEDMMSKKFLPDWAPPPGHFMAEALKEKGMTEVQFVEKMGLSKSFTAALLSGRERLSSKHAVKLEEVLGQSAATWMRRERDFIYATQEAEFFRNVMGL